MLSGEIKTNELKASIYTDDSMYLTSSRWWSMGGSTVEDRISMTGSDAKELYQMLKEHFEGEKADGR